MAHVDLVPDARIAQAPDGWEEERSLPRASSPLSQRATDLDNRQNGAHSSGKEDTKVAQVHLLSLLSWFLTH